MPQVVRPQSDLGVSNVKSTHTETDPNIPMYAVAYEGAHQLYYNSDNARRRRH